MIMIGFVKRAVEATGEKPWVFQAPEMVSEVVVDFASSLVYTSGVGKGLKAVACLDYKC